MTGSPDQPLGEPDAKARLTESVGEEFNHHSLVALASTDPRRNGLQHVGSVKEAAAVVFGFVPWHAQNPAIPRIHAYCRDVDQKVLPPRWDGLPNIRRVKLPTDFAPQKISPEDGKKMVEDASETISTEFSGAEGFELTLAAPNAFAPCLGRSLGRGGPPIRLVHKRDNKVWWTTHPVLPLLQPGKPGQEVRLALTRHAQRAPSPWKPLTLNRENLTPDDVQPYLDLLRTAALDGTTVHLGVDVPWVIGFAAGALLANQRKLISWGWDNQKNEYLRWYETP